MSDTTPYEDGYCDGLRKGAATERERIAAWLEADDGYTKDYIGAWHDFATRIRNGEHETGKAK